jgi:hypothetical protein
MNRVRTTHKKQRDPQSNRQSVSPGTQTGVVLKNSASVGANFFLRIPTCPKASLVPCADSISRATLIGTRPFFHAGWTYRVETVNISVFAEHLVTTLTAKNRSNTPRGDLRSDSAPREGRFGVALATGTKIA